MNLTKLSSFPKTYFFIIGTYISRPGGGGIKRMSLIYAQKTRIEMAQTGFRDALNNRRTIYLSFNKVKISFVLQTLFQKRSTWTYFLHIDKELFSSICQNIQRYSVGKIRKNRKMTIKVSSTFLEGNVLRDRPLVGIFKLRGIQKTLWILYGPF